MFDRLLDLRHILSGRSVFLLGPRRTGKSTLLRERFPEAKVFDLLAADTFRELSSKPESMRQSLRERDNLIVIDEIQKLPNLLDEVHLLIERNKDLRFILTGSSARKLKRSGVNLLAGRAWTKYLFPLVWPETGRELLYKRLCFGGLPSILNSEDPSMDLKEYVGIYLQEEIRAESLARSIEAFSRFLSVAGATNGKQLNYTKVGNDAQVPPRTVQEYFQVLEDTLVGFQLPPYPKTVERKPVAISKFYFFDIGVAHSLKGIREVPIGSEIYGEALEHLIALELRAFLSYRAKDMPLTYWRSRSKLEVDFVIGDCVAVEIKGAGRVSQRDCKGIRALAQECKLKKKIIVSNQREELILEDQIEIMPVETFLDKLWAGEITQ